MHKTIQQIKEISFELIRTINDSQKLEKLASMARTEFEDEDENIVDIVDQKVDKKNEEIRELIEGLLPLIRLYLALTTPYDPTPYSVLLEALYADYKQLVSIGPDPEQGYDRSYESEKSRIEEQIDSLESELLNENPYSVEAREKLGLL